MLRILCAAALLCGFSEGSAEVKVLAFSGSTREDSANKKLVREAARFAEEQGAEVTVIDLRDYSMPFYDADLEAAEGMPEKAKAFRQKMLESDVIFIASPNYNHSFPAVLKNALDWASRTETGDRAKGAFKGIRVAIMSASPGKGGGAGGLPHLRDVLLDMGLTVMEKQVSLPNAYNAFDEQGILLNAEVSASLQEQVTEALAPL